MLLETGGFVSVFCFADVNDKLFYYSCSLQVPALIFWGLHLFVSCLSHPIWNKFTNCLASRQNCPAKPEHSGQVFIWTWKMSSCFFSILSFFFISQCRPCAWLLSSIKFVLKVTTFTTVVCSSIFLNFPKCQFCIIFVSFNMTKNWLVFKYYYEVSHSGIHPFKTKQLLLSFELLYLSEDFFHRQNIYILLLPFFFWL